MKRKVITSTTLAKELVNAGFKIIDLAPHKTNNTRTVFIFENTKELELYLEVKEDRKINDKPNTNQRRNKNHYK